jgi:hypothetical protein
MNAYKPLALFSTAALVVVLGYNVASARPAEPTPAPAEHDYRRLHAALDNLRIARDHLMNAEHNHGGWRERAVEATDRAIHETEIALEWHP